MTNIIFVLVDALNARNLGCFGYDNISPNIDKLAAKGAVFKKCFSCANASDTALTSLMSGMYPHSHGITHHSFDVSDSQLRNFEERNVKLMQQVLQKNGYSTSGLDFLGRWHNRGYDYYPALKIDRTKRKKQMHNMQLIFEFFHVKEFFKKVYRMNTFKKIFGGFDSYPNDIETTAKAIEIMKQKKNPFFLFVHYWGVHKPYTCPNVTDKLSVACYDDAIKKVDSHVGELMGAADENTVFVLVGDHGESLGEHGISFDHHGLYDASMHVPLIISGKGIPAVQFQELTSIIDIFPTVLDIAGVTHDQKIDGENLIPFIEGKKKIVRDYIIGSENYYQDKISIRTDDYKYIKRIGRGTCGKCQIVHGGDIELYDLQNDPEELHNIAGEQESLVYVLDKELEHSISH